MFLNICSLDILNYLHGEVFHRIVSGFQLQTAPQGIFYRSGLPISHPVTYILNGKQFNVQDVEHYFLKSNELFLQGGIISNCYMQVVEAEWNYDTGIKIVTTKKSWRAISVN